MVNSGASNPEECEFVVTSGSGVEDVSCVGSMLAFDEDGPGTVLSTYRMRSINHVLEPQAVT